MHACVLKIVWSHLNNQPFWCMQAVQQMLQTFTNAPALITLLDALGKAILAVVQQQQQADALAQELPLLAAAFDHASCSIQASGQMQQQVWNLLWTRTVRLRLLGQIRHG